MTVSNEFFTIQSMLTLSGATGATFVIANGFQVAFNFNPRWLALAIAMLISLFGVHYSDGSGSDYFVGVVNGFLIYSTTVGASTIGGTDQNQRLTTRGANEASQPITSSLRRRFLTRWF